MGGTALATILATAAGAQSPSWPTPPAPQAENPAAPQGESPTAPQTKPASPLLPARLGQMLAPIALYPDDLLAEVLAAATYPLGGISRSTASDWPCLTGTGTATTARSGAMTPVTGATFPTGMRRVGGGPLSTAGIQPRFGGVQPSLEGVNPSFRPLVDSGAQPFGGRRPGAIAARPSGARASEPSSQHSRVFDPTWERAPVGAALDPDAERRILIERWSFGRVPPTALAAPSGGLRASPSFDGILSSQSLGGRRSFRPLVGIGAQPARRHRRSAVRRERAADAVRRHGSGRRQGRQLNEAHAPRGASDFSKREAHVKCVQIRK